MEEPPLRRPPGPAARRGGRTVRPGATLEAKFQALLELSQTERSMTDTIIKEFGDECHRVFAFWRMLKCLFDDNTDVTCLKAPHYEHFFYTIRSALYDACTQGIVRLHDPAIQLGRKNLTVNYIVEKMQWSAQQKGKLEDLRREMRRFVDKLKPGRNRFTAHNDLDTLLQKIPFGLFEIGEDQEYFCNLEQFASIVFGEQFIFSDSLIENDVAFFMTAFKQGMVPLQ
jgi:hypothetical protein